MVFVLIAFPVVLYVLYVLVMNRLDAVRELGDLRRSSTDRRAARSHQRSLPASPRGGGSASGARRDLADTVRPNPSASGFPGRGMGADRSRSGPLPRTSRQAPSLERREAVPRSWIERHKLKRAQLKREGLRRKEARRQAAAAKALRPRGPGSRKARAEARLSGAVAPTPSPRRPATSGRTSSAGRPSRPDPGGGHERLKPQHIDMDFEDTAWSTVFARTPRDQMTPPDMEDPDAVPDPRAARRPHDDRPHGIPGPPGSSRRRRRSR